MKNVGMVVLFLALTACGETQVASPQVASPEATLLPEQHARATIRLRLVSPDDWVQRQSFSVVKRTLTDEGFAVTDEGGASYDVDMRIESRALEDARGKRMAVTLVSQVGRRMMSPLTAEFESGDGTIDEDSLVEASMRWCRRYNRGAQAGKRHAHPEHVGQAGQVLGYADASNSR